MSFGKILALVWLVVALLFQGLQITSGQNDWWCAARSAGFATVCTIAFVLFMMQTLFGQSLQHWLRTGEWVEFVIQID
jgi:hypothetical protein